MPFSRQSLVLAFSKAVTFFLRAFQVQLDRLGHVAKSARKRLLETTEKGISKSTSVWLLIAIHTVLHSGHCRPHRGPQK
jgi:hypothetical protein